MKKKSDDIFDWNLGSKSDKAFNWNMDENIMSNAFDIGFKKKLKGKPTGGIGLDIDMGDHYWAGALANFPSYEKDFNSALGFTVDDGFPEDRQPESFRRDFKRMSSERIERLESGEMPMAEDDNMFGIKQRNEPSSFGNIYDNKEELGRKKQGIGRNKI